MSRLLFCLAVVGMCCGQNCLVRDSVPIDDSNSNSTTPTTATLKHSGFDFSKNNGTVPAEGGDVADADGDIIAWSPEPTLWIGDDTSVWWRSYANTTDTNYSKDCGEVSLDSVTTIPDSWDGTTDTSLPPLAVGHVYVVKCLDGYAKFLVNEVRTTPEWEADVEFVFTSGSSF